MYRREYFIKRLNYETLLTYEECKGTVNNIPDMHINKAIDIYNKSGFYGFKIFVKGLNIVKESERVKALNEALNKISDIQSEDN